MACVFKHFVCVILINSQPEWQIDGREEHKEV